MARAIIILGMHRSGTSCLTGSLQEAGLQLGEVNQKTRCNEKGTRENVAIMELNDAVLESASASWDRPPTGPVDWRNDHKTWRNHLIKAMAQEPVWGFKDPRTLFTFDGWREALPGAQLIATFRDPIAVAKSLNKRNELPLERGIELWRAYNERLLSICENHDVAVVSFDWSPLRYRQGLEALCANIGLEPPANGFSFFETRLRRNESASPLDLPPALRSIHRRLQTRARMTIHCIRNKTTVLSTNLHGAKHGRADNKGEPVVGNTRSAGLIPQSVRLFPKNTGAAGYVSSGIAARCDWLVLSDGVEPNVVLRRHRETSNPRHIFLSMRSPFVAIQHFAAQILPRLTSPFVLVSGSEDATVPLQTDKRWRPYNEQERGAIAQILNHGLLRRWFAENLVDNNDKRFSPLPTGWVYEECREPHRIIVPAPPPLKNRPLRVLCGHRIRNGAQWSNRRTVSAIAENEWASWCTILKDEVPLDEFLRLIEQHSFVLCVEGGGVDPSPKAWQAVLHGAIPIIRRNALAPAYRDLPVAFVNEWTKEEITPDKLEAWRRELAPDHDTQAKRAETIRRLGIDYWWDKIERAATDSGSNTRLL